MSPYEFAITFASEHWFLTWCALWLLWIPYLLVGRLLRCILVLARGWPPAHLDADGDWKPQPKESE